MPEPNLDDLAADFVAMIGALQLKSALLPDMFSDESQRLILNLLRAAAFPAHSLIPKKERRNYGNDNVGDDIQLINPHSPFSVCWHDDDFRIREDCRLKAHDEATIWLDEQIAGVWKNREKKSATALASDLAAAIESAIPLKPIVITRFGDKLLEYRNGREHKRDESRFGSHAGWHAECCGVIEVMPCSREWRVLVCKTCYLRLYIPSSVSTYGGLRSFFAQLTNEQLFRT